MVIKFHLKISEVFFYTAPAFFVVYGSNPCFVLNGVTKSTTLFCTTVVSVCSQGTCQLSFTAV